MPVDLHVRELQDQLDRQRLIRDEIFNRADSEGRDPTPDEQKLYAETVERIAKLTPQFDLYTRSLEVENESRDRASQLSAALSRRTIAEPAGAVEYRSAGAYVYDCLKMMRGDRAATERLDVYNRAAAHQTTTNAAGIVPQLIVGPLVNFIDSARPLVSALGPRVLEGGPQFFRPRVTTHTSVAKQSAEKAEFASQAMVIDKLTATVDTYGGYVNVSRQLIDWSTPGAMDIITGDLAAVYAQQTESAACVAFQTAATAGTTIPTGATDAAAIHAAVWAAVGTIYGTVKGVGRIVGVASPAMLGIIGPAFAPVNPTNAFSTGFNAVDFGSGLMGNIGGVPIYVSPGVTGNTLLIMSSAAAEVY